MSSSSATGLYRVEGDSLVPLGYYMGPNRVVAPEKRDGYAAGPGFGIPARARGAGPQWLDAMGRLAARVTATGLYLTSGAVGPAK